MKCWSWDLGRSGKSELGSAFPYGAILVMVFSIFPYIKGLEAIWLSISTVFSNGSVEWLAGTVVISHLLTQMTILWVEGRYLEIRLPLMHAFNIGQYISYKDLALWYRSPIPLLILWFKTQLWCWLYHILCLFYSLIPSIGRLKRLTLRIIHDIACKVLVLVIVGNMC